MGDKQTEALSLQQQNTFLRGQLESCEKSLQGKDNECCKLRLSIEGADDLAAKNATANANLRSEVASLKQQLENSEAQLKSSGELYTNLQEEMRVSNKTLKELLAANDATKTSLEGILDLQEAHRTSEEISNYAFKNLEKEMGKAQEDARILRQKKEEWKASAKKRTKRLQSEESHIEEQNDVIDALNERVKCLEHCRSKLVFHAYKSLYGNEASELDGITAPLEQIVSSTKHDIEHIQEGVQGIYERIEQVCVDVQGFREKEKRKNRELRAKLSLEQKFKARLESRLARFNERLALAIPSPLEARPGMSSQ